MLAFNTIIPHNICTLYATDKTITLIPPFGHNPQILEIPN